MSNCSSVVDACVLAGYCFTPPSSLQIHYLIYFYSRSVAKETKSLVEFGHEECSI